MDWSDLLVKIAVGACLGFGIITIAKLVSKKNKKSQSSEHSDGAAKQDSSDIDHNKP